ncbi:MAG: DUF1887 family protein [Candidatus Pacebacteria bacterium]|nr:DUF1887 family protein [Candidatus Paceibacterota bacterium]
MQKFDVVVHLAGEQILPLYMAIEQFDCDNHLVIVTERTDHIFERLRGYYRPTGKTFKKITVAPYQLGADTVRKIKDAVHETAGQSNVGFNLTGGTKPMFAVAFAACQQIKGTPFYIETSGKTVDYLAGDFGREKLTPSLTIEACVKLAGHTVRDSGRWEDITNLGTKRSLLPWLWKNRSAVSAVYKEIAPFTDNPGTPFHCTRNRYGKRVEVELNRAGTGRMTIDGETRNLGEFPDLATFVCGGWLELYCYQTLIPLRNAGQLKDMRVGFIPGWDSATVDRDAQEFDLVCTDGYTLTIAECKAGFVKQEHLQKLENNVLHYGGAFGRGVLLSAFPFTRNSGAMRRIQSSSCLSAVAGSSLEYELQRRILEAKPGVVYSSRSGKKRR